MSNSSFFALFEASHVISPLHLILDEKQQTIFAGRVHSFFQPVLGSQSLKNAKR